LVIALGSRGWRIACSIAWAPAICAGEGTAQMKSMSWCSIRSFSVLVSIAACACGTGGAPPRAERLANLPSDAVLADVSGAQCSLPDQDPVDGLACVCDQCDTDDGSCPLGADGDWPPTATLDPLAMPAGALGGVAHCVKAEGKRCPEDIPQKDRWRWEFCINVGLISGYEKMCDSFPSPAKELCKAMTKGLKKACCDNVWWAIEYLKSDPGWFCVAGAAASKGTTAERQKKCLDCCDKAFPQHGDDPEASWFQSCQNKCSYQAYFE
jgi:hypothetical protein